MTTIEVCSRSERVGNCGEYADQVERPAPTTVGAPSAPPPPLRGYVVVSRPGSGGAEEVEFVHSTRSIADAERRTLARADRSRSFVTRPTNLREITPTAAGI